MRFYVIFGSEMHSLWCYYFFVVYLNCTSALWVAHAFIYILYQVSKLIFNSCFSLMNDQKEADSYINSCSNVVLSNLYGTNPCLK